MLSRATPGKYGWLVRCNLDIPGTTTVSVYFTEDCDHHAVSDFLNWYDSRALLCPNYKFVPLDEDPNDPAACRFWMGCGGGWAYFDIPRKNVVCRKWLATMLDEGGLDDVYFGATDSAKSNYPKLDPTCQGRHRHMHSRADSKTG